MAKSPKYHSERYRRVLDALAMARRERSDLDSTVRRVGTSISDVKRYAGSAIIYRTGRWWARPSDTLPRPMWLLTDRGNVTIPTEDSAEATLISEHHNAIRTYLQTGDAAVLREFEDLEFVDEDGNRRKPATNPRTINRLARAGEINYLDIYLSDGE